MARYFFHLADHITLTDQIGTEFATPEEARIHSIRLMCDFLSRQSEEIWKGTTLRVQVTDSEGAMLFNVMSRGVTA